jgi:hypothetical protein
VIWTIGIDPGATGGFAVLDSDGRLTDVVALPTFGPETDSSALAALLEAVAPVDDLFVGVESPFANNRASSISQLNQGIGFGQILGSQRAAHPPRADPAPRVEVGDGVPDGAEADGGEEEGCVPADRR